MRRRRLVKCGSPTGATANAGTLGRVVAETERARFCDMLGGTCLHRKCKNAMEMKATPVNNGSLEPPKKKHVTSKTDNDRRDYCAQSARTGVSRCVVCAEGVRVTCALMK